MADFAFDTSAIVLSPAVPPSLPQPTNTRSSARFEDHLGQATRPREDSAYSSERFDDRKSMASSASTSGARPDESRPPDDNTQTQPVEAAESRKEGDDAERDAREQNDAADASAAAEAAAPQAADKMPEKQPGKRSADGSDAEGEADGVGAIDSTAKGAQARRGKHIAGEGVDDHIGHAKPSAAVDDESADPVVEDESATKKGAAGQAQSALEAAAESTADVATIAGIASGVKTTSGSANGDTTTPSGEDASHDTLTAAQTAGTAKASGRARNKYEESAAQGNAQSSPEEKLAAMAGSLGALDEVTTSIAGDGDESTGSHDQSSDEKTPSDRNEPTELRAGAAPALLTARGEKGHEPSGRAEGLTEAERVRFVQRVASAFRSLGDEGGEVRLRLSPPELGSLRVELTVRDGVLNARLETETASARNVLLDNLPALRDRLAEQNIKVEKFDVDVRDDRRQPTGEQFTGQPDHGRQQDRQRPRAFDHGTTTAPATRATRAPIKHGDASELNIVI